MFPIRRTRFLIATLAVLAAGFLAGCAAPKPQIGFDPKAFASVPGSKIQVLMRVPPGTDVNAGVQLILVEGGAGDSKPASHPFELERHGGAVPARSGGSTILSFSLRDPDFARYDKARRIISRRLTLDQSASIRVRAKLCREAGLNVGPPFLFGVLVQSVERQPIYLGELPIPPEEAKENLPFCI